MILYMTSTPGGFDRRTGLPEKLDNRNHFVDRLKADWKEHSRGLLISSDPDNSDMNSAMAQTYLDAFNKSGLSMDAIDVLDSRDEETVEILGKYDVIILAGGHVPTENAWFKRIKLRERLRGYRGIVIGISAGTMNCADVVYAQPEREGESKDEKYERFIEGLGLTDTNVIPHYNQTIDAILDGKRLFQEITYPDSMNRAFYCLTDGAYIRKDMNSNKEMLYGETYLIADGEIGLICKTGGEFEIPTHPDMKKPAILMAAALTVGSLLGAGIMKYAMKKRDE
ncbi:Type 1 glutamine amidotransferase-like domain-containing protein [Oribacterium sp. WCC10]|uniref:Type 1 glutamine amidotransferase-like domain-containing protein n=1 Tax=Oribacterium sp. WCC10 TaxID=1855343 RepID=UPI0008DF03BC|nr:Type 1 glutamine amidotransferase-like domain-containing protein [Oribacterium sp. WCC10]SFG74508.1 dipeptidase E [Oribacterium sp. WCC10]